MATTRSGDEPQVTRAERAESVVREVIAGHEQGAVRRIILYTVLGASLFAGFYAPPFLVLAIVATMLLIATDAL